MPDNAVPLSLNARGALDTANPVTDRAPGTLIIAKDTHSRYWGPRAGNQAFTRAWEAPGTAALYDEVTFLQAAATSFASARNHEDQFRDLGLAFTLDLFIRYEDLAYAPTIDVVKLYDFSANGLGRLTVDIMGPNHADHERVRVTLTTSATRTSADTPVAFTGATRIAAGTGQADKVHIRFVRDAAQGYLYVSGVLDGTTGSYSGTHVVNAETGQPGTVTLADSSSTGTTIRFKGKVYAAVLRDGAFRTAPIENTLPAAPWAKNVHHYYLGRDYTLGGSVHHIPDMSRFGAHAVIVGTDYSVNAANDDTAPAPCRVQGMRSWTTRNARTATAVMAGGILSTEYVA